MVEYNKVNVRLSDTQLKKLKNAVKNKTGTTLRISLKMRNGNNLPHELLLTTRQKTKARNAFNNNMSTDLKLSKAQFSKIIQSGGFLGRLLGPLLKTGLPSIKNVIKPLAKIVLIPLGLTAAAYAAYAGIHKKILGSGNTTLIISNEEMNDIMKIIQALEDSTILLKGVTKTIKNEIKEQKGGFLSMLLCTLGASLLGNLWTGKGIVRAGANHPLSSSLKNKKGKGIVRAGTGKKMEFLMLPHPLTTFEIQKYKNEPRFNGVFSRNNLSKKIKDAAYIINLDEYVDVGTHWIALFCKKMKLFISIVLVLNLFLKKFKNLLETFLEIKI